jgi:hypothetical protein
MWCMIRYVPAYSPRLRFEEYGWKLIPLEAGDRMGAADPVYTESYWNSISIRAYQQEDIWYEEFVLFIGVCDPHIHPFDIELDDFSQETAEAGLIKHIRLCIRC